MTWTNVAAGTSATGTYIMPVITSGSGTTWPGSVTVYGGGGGSVGGSWTPPPPLAALSPLEWLDSEVEKTCALARQG